MRHIPISSKMLHRQRFLEFLPKHAHQIFNHSFQEFESLCQTHYRLIIH